MVKKFDKAGKLMLLVLGLLHKRESTLKEIGQRTGLPLPWLYLLTEGGIKNPSVNRIEYLYEHLTGNRLEVKA